MNILQLVKDWLCEERNGQWAIIVDNADDAALFFRPAGTKQGGEGSLQSTTSTSLATFLPRSPNGSILFTSRNKDVVTRLVGGPGNVIEIGPMSEEEGLNLLRNKLDHEGRQRDDTSDLLLLQAVDYMPLAVTQAAAYITRLGPRGSVSDYLRSFHKSEESRASLLMGAVNDLWRDHGGRDSIFTTWQVSFEKIRKERRSAADLLSLMSFFNRQGIPDFVLRDYKGFEVTDTRSKERQTSYAGLKPRKSLFSRQRFSAFVRRSRRAPKPLHTTDFDDQTQTEDYDDQEFEEDLAVLRSYCLITDEKDGSTFGMHRLVQMSTRMWLKVHNQFHGWNSTFLAVMAAKMPWGTDVVDWPRCEALFPHAEAAEVEDVVPGSLSDWSTTVLNAAEFAGRMGRYDVAERMARQVMNINERSSGWANYGTLKAADQVNYFLLDQGRYKEAKKMSERVLRARERFHNEDHIDARFSISNLADAYLRLGDYKRAEEMYLRAIKCSEKFYGRDHICTVETMADLGSVYVDQRRWEEAEEMLQRVVNFDRKFYGEEDPNTLTGIYNLATVYSEQGKHEIAEEMHQRVLKGSEKLLGKGHPDTLTSIGSLGYMYLEQGRYQQAEVMMRRALKGREKALGGEHPNTLRSMFYLGNVYLTGQEDGIAGLQGGHIRDFSANDIWVSKSHIEVRAVLEE